MAHLIGPDFVALQVRDLERSRQFYTAAHGLDPSSFQSARSSRFRHGPHSLRDS